MIVYLARAIQAFVMYCVNGTSRSSLLIESTDSMIMYYVHESGNWLIPERVWMCIISTGEYGCVLLVQVSMDVYY